MIYIKNIYINIKKKKKKTFLILNENYLIYLYINKVSYIRIYYQIY